MDMRLEERTAEWVIKVLFRGGDAARPNVYCREYVAWVAVLDGLAEEVGIAPAFRYDGGSVASVPYVDRLIRAGVDPDRIIAAQNLISDLRG